MILLMEEILHQLICSFSHYLQGFTHPRWLFGISEPSTAISSLSGYLTTRHLYSIFTKIPNFYNQLHTTTLSPPMNFQKLSLWKNLPQGKVSTPPGRRGLDLQQHGGIILRRRHGRRWRQLLTSCRWYQGLDWRMGSPPTLEIPWFPLKGG